MKTSVKMTVGTREDISGLVRRQFGLDVRELLVRWGMPGMQGSGK